MGSRRLTAASLATTLAAGLLAFATPAKAEVADWHICYLENPATLRVDPFDALRGGAGYYAIPFAESSFSGDCPSFAERSLDPHDLGIFYTSGGVDHNVSGMVSALWNDRSDRGLFFNTYASGPVRLGGTWELVPQYSYDPAKNLDIDGNPIWSPYLIFGLPVNYSAAFGKPFAASALRVPHVWTGNEATEDCDYVDSLTCAGGYTYADYEFRTRNAVTVKNDTSISVLKVSGGKRLAVTVRINRKLISNTTGNPNSVEIRALPGDRVSVKVGGKKYYSRIVNSSTGKVTIYVPNPAGKQKFTVGIRSTRLNWGATKTFSR